MSSLQIIALLLILFLYMIMIFFFSMAVKVKIKDKENIPNVLKILVFSQWKVQLFLLTINLLLLFLLIIPTPDIISPRLPIFDPLLITNDQPLKLQFSRPIWKFTEAEITPAIPGIWKKSGKIPFLTDTLVFIPDQSLDPDAEYLIEVKRILNILPLFNKQYHNLLFVVKTPPLPEITKIIPVENAKLNEPFEITFSNPSIENVEWIIESKPFNNFLIKFSEDRLRAFLLPQMPLLQDTVYYLNLFRRTLVYDYQSARIISKSDKELVKQIEVKTVSSPGLEKVSPSDRKLTPKEPLIIRFTNEMNKQNLTAGIKITPSVEVNFNWLNDQELEISPVNFWDSDIIYNLIISRGSDSLSGGRLPEDMSIVFQTLGPVAVQYFSPEAGSKNVKTDAPIMFTFDQEIDKDSLIEHFSISPQVEGELFLNGNELQFHPYQKLKNNQEYSILLSKGIKSKSGLDSNADFSLNFKTIPETFSLDIPLLKQHHAFSCYSTAANMILAYRGVTGVDELSFMDEVGHDDTPRNFLKNIWGNPNQAIVGSLDGEKSGGYGAHWGPVSKTIGKYRPTEVKTNWNINELLDKVYEGNPVIVWWVNGVWPTRDISWSLPSGEEIYAVSGMHTEVVTGWVGDQTDPVYILTNDPWRGKRRYTQKQFENLWKWFQNTAVIVY